MVKNYKDTIISLGGSDVACLICRGFLKNSDNSEYEYKAELLNFGEDGEYDAYLVTDPEVEIPSYYTKRLQFQHGIDIFDDFQKVADLGDLNTIGNIYRAGDFGCIIQILSENSL